MLPRTIVLLALLVPLLSRAQEEVPIVMDPTPPTIEPRDEAIDPDAVLRVVEHMPQFPGGMDSLRAYMARTVQYPAEAQAVGASGRVFLEFVVERDGALSNIKVIRGAHPLLNEEAIRAVRRMPRWKPGTHRGQPRRVVQTLPVTFVVQR